MIVILCCAIAAGVLRTVAGTWGAREIQTLAVILLGVSIPCALFCCRRFRGFFMGFGLFGWGYLALAQGWADPAIPEYLPTTQVLDVVFKRLDSGGEDPRDSFDGGFRKDQRSTRFRAGGHAILSLLLGVIGGVSGVVLSGDRGTSLKKPDPRDGRLLEGPFRREIFRPSR
jgi:hypothetical protein